jgi:hypothetical protein
MISITRLVTKGDQYREYPELPPIGPLAETARRERGQVTRFAFFDNLGGSI